MRFTAVLGFAAVAIAAPVPQGLLSLLNPLNPYAPINSLNPLSPLNPIYPTSPANPINQLLNPFNPANPVSAGIQGFTDALTGGSGYGASYDNDDKH